MDHTKIINTVLSNMPEISGTTKSLTAEEYEWLRKDNNRKEFLQKYKRYTDKKAPNFQQLLYSLSYNFCKPIVNYSSKFSIKCKPSGFLTLLMWGFIKDDLYLKGTDFEAYYRLYKDHVYIQFKYVKNVELKISDR